MHHKIDDDHGNASRLKLIDIIMAMRNHYNDKKLKNKLTYLTVVQMNR